MKYQPYIALAIPATLLLLLLGTLVALPRSQQESSIGKAATPIPTQVTNLAPIVVRPPPRLHQAALSPSRGSATATDDLSQWGAVSLDWSASGAGSDLTMPYYSFGAAVLTRAGD